MSQPPFRPTPVQIERRRQHVARLRDAGHSLTEIAEALSVSPSTVGNDATALIRHGLTSRRHVGRGNGLGFTPPAVQWWLTPPPVVGLPAYQRSETLALVTRTTSHLVDINAVNTFANDIIDAKKAGDRQWLGLARGAIDALTDYVARLNHAINNPDAVASDIRERDDLRPERSRP